MKKLAGIIGAVALGLTLTFGVANAQTSSPTSGYGGWNCPWSYGTSGNGYGPSYRGRRNTTATKGTNYRGNRYTGNPRYNGYGTYCAYGPGYGW